MKKYLRRLIAASLMVGSLMFMPITHASVETYVGTGEYTMSEYETPHVAQQRAKFYAERNAQEQAGLFIRSQSKVENSKLTEDEIITMSAGIVKLLDVNIQPIVLDAHTFKFIATVKVDIDTDEINSWLEQEAQQRLDLIEENKALRQKIAEQEALLAQSKKDTVNAKTEEQKRELKQRFEQADNEFAAIQKLREGNQAIEHSEALKLYSEAIELDPNYAMAYNNRGYTYTELKQYNQALADLNRALELDPALKLAYNNRGRVYRRLNDFERALADYNKAIELDPKYSTAYNNRGYMYDDLKQYERAIADYTRAIEYAPNFAMAYNNRGFTYINMKEFARAIEDLNKAIELDPKFDWAYNNRGTAYLLTNDIARALADFNKAIECNPNYALAYKNRGYCHQALGEMTKAQSDFDKAKSLGG